MDFYLVILPNVILYITIIIFLIIFLIDMNNVNKSLKSYKCLHETVNLFYANIDIPNVYNNIRQFSDILEKSYKVKISQHKANLIYDSINIEIQDLLQDDIPLIKKSLRTETLKNIIN